MPRRPTLRSVLVPYGHCARSHDRSLKHKIPIRGCCHFKLIEVKTWRCRTGLILQEIAKSLELIGSTLCY